MFEASWLQGFYISFKPEGQCVCFTYRRAEKYYKKEPVDIICYVSNDGLVPVFVQRTERLVLLVFSTGLSKIRT